MTDILLFLLGTLITAMTVAAVVAVGRSEARDPANNRIGEQGDAV